jgi:hypothetical protein
VVIPVGRKGEATIEGLLDTGGACTMGDLVYWREVASRCPGLIAQFEELSDHQKIQSPLEESEQAKWRSLISWAFGYLGWSATRTPSWSWVSEKTCLLLF